MLSGSKCSSFLPWRLNKTPAAITMRRRFSTFFAIFPRTVSPPSTQEPCEPGRTGGAPTISGSGRRRERSSVFRVVLGQSNEDTTPSGFHGAGLRGSTHLPGVGARVAGAKTPSLIHPRIHICPTVCLTSANTQLRCNEDSRSLHGSGPPTSFRDIQWPFRNFLSRADTWGWSWRVRRDWLRARPSVP